LTMPAKSSLAATRLTSGLKWQETGSSSCMSNSPADRSWNAKLMYRAFDPT